MGVRSDRAISAQLEEVVSSYQPDEAILITDGAEDEAVLPIIQSQVRIDHVEKIIVKQSKGIEGTYYYIVKALEDPKWRARFMVPLGLVLAIFGLGIMLPNEIGGIVIGSLPLLLGLFIFAKGAGIETTVNRVIQEMLRPKRGSFSGSLIVLSIFGMVVYSFVNTSLQIAIDILQGNAYEFEVSNIINTLSVPFGWIAVLWVTMTILKGLRQKQAQSERYWGI